MYIPVLLMALLASLAAGYYSASPGLRAGEQSLVAELKDDASKPPSRSLTFAMSVIAQEGARARGKRISGALAVESALDRVERSPREAELYRLLGSDTLGQRIGRSLIAQSHREVPGVDLYVKNFVDELAHDPQGPGAVKAALDRIPASQFPLERMALVTALAANPDNADTVKSMALGELTQNPPEPRPDPQTATTDAELNAAFSTTAAQARPIAAQGLFLKNTQNPGEALSATIDGIVTQTDWGVRAMLAQQFLTAYPDMTSQLHDGLASRGVTLQLGQGE